MMTRQFIALRFSIFLYFKLTLVFTSGLIFILKINLNQINLNIFGLFYKEEIHIHLYLYLYFIKKSSETVEKREQMLDAGKKKSLKLP